MHLKLFKGPAVTQARLRAAKLAPHNHDQSKAVLTWLCLKLCQVLITMHKLIRNFKLQRKKKEIRKKPNKRQLRIT